MSTVKSLLICVGVGAVLGILYAPARGSETRRRIAETGDDLRERFNDLKDSITNKLETFKEDMNDMAYKEMNRIDTEASSAQRPSWQS